MAKNIETYSTRVDMLNDLMSCYREVAPDCISQSKAWERTLAHPAKRFYITPKQAYQRINKYIKGCTEAIDSLKPLQAKQFHDIIKVIEELMQSPEYANMSLWKICRVAVLRPAPQFYITPRWFSEIFSDLVKYKFFDEEGRNLKYVARWQDPKCRERQRLSSLKYRNVYIR